jgi:hypothetical protein
MGEISSRQLVLLVIAIVLGSIFFVQYQRASPIDRQGVFPTGIIGPAKQEGVTLAAFYNLRDGMSYRQVVATLGREGTLEGESVTPGFPNGELRITSYAWPGRGMIGANMSVMFQNDRLTMKNQFGLE